MAGDESKADEVCRFVEEHLSTTYSLDDYDTVVMHTLITAAILHPRGALLALAYNSN